MVPPAGAVVLSSAPRNSSTSAAHPHSCSSQHRSWPQVADIIPAVTHVDCTARLQTVGEQDDPFLRSLLQAFDARTGVPVVLNTSFNRKEEPIVETPAQALESFRRTPMHALGDAALSGAQACRTRSSHSCRKHGEHTVIQGYPARAGVAPGE